MKVHETKAYVTESYGRVLGDVKARRVARRLEKRGTTRANTADDSVTLPSKGEAPNPEAGATQASWMGARRSG